MKKLEITPEQFDRIFEKLDSEDIGVEDIARAEGWNASKLFWEITEERQRRAGWPGIVEFDTSTPGFTPSDPPKEETRRLKLPKPDPMGPWNHITNGEERKRAQKAIEWRKCDPLMTSAEHLEIVRLYTKDKLVGKEIAERVGMSMNTVYRHLRLEGIERTARSRVEADCPHCKSLFEVKRSVYARALRSKRRLFCSKDCWRRYKSRRMSKSDTSNGKKKTSNGKSDTSGGKRENSDIKID